MGRNGLARHATLSKIDRMRLPGLLVMLGFKKRDVYRRRRDAEPTLCWRPKDQRNEWALKETYKMAHLKYRERLKQVHPDSGGTMEECIAINRVWERIKYLLKLRGLT